MAIEHVNATLVYPPGVGSSYSKDMAYMFYGDSYCKWNLSTDKLEQGPRKIKDYWSGFPFDRVDATLVYPPGVGPSYTNDMAYMFCGDSYCKWNLSTDKLEQGPRKIKDYWSGFPFDRVDATLVYPPGVGSSYTKDMAYMFCGDSYCKWNLSTDKLEQGPRKIKDYWSGFPFDRVDATLVYPPGVGPSYTQNMAYMFCGDSYCKWDLKEDKIYTTKINDGWKGYPF